MSKVGKVNLPTSFLDDAELDDEREDEEEGPTQQNVGVEINNSRTKPAYVIPLEYVKSGSVLKVLKITGQGKRWAKWCTEKDFDTPSG